MHASDFVPLVLVGVLDDAKAVRPEVTKSKSVRNADRVPNGLREYRGVDAIGVGRDVGRGRAVGLRLAPNVAEGSVAAAFALRCYQAWGTGVDAVDEACGQERIAIGDFLAAFVRLHALIDECFCKGEGLQGPDVQDRASCVNVGCSGIVLKSAWSITPLR